MFIHIGAFNFITVNLSSSASKNGKVRNRVAYKKKKKKKPKDINLSSGQFLLPGRWKPY